MRSSRPSRWYRVHGHRDQAADHDQGGQGAVDDQGGDVRPAAVPRLLAGQAEQGEHGQQAEDAAAQGHRGQRVEPERLVGRSRGRWPAPAGPGVAQSPLAWASPSWVRRSRSSEAVAGRRPQTLASVVAAAVCSLTWTRPKERSMGPASTSTSCIRP